ncbi:MAG: flagellar motor switch phosphatase FliY [Clostridia bacterium]|nr:flagellar motor switch phosphatase FliY [Clostridia bacterium]
MGKELTQEEIDKLLNSTLANQAPSSLTDDEKDMLGEIGNISMGTSATALSKILNRKVSITTPKVSIMKTSKLAEDYDKPYVAIEINYTEGLIGKNILNLKNDDVKIITDLMMGGKGVVAEGPISEMNLSAAGELMNQMMGSSSTALSEMLNTRIDISPPQPREINYSANELNEVIDEQDEIVIVMFDLYVENTLESEIMQIMPVSFAKDMVIKLKNIFFKKAKEEPVKESKPQPSPAPVESESKKVNIQKIEFTAFGEEKQVKTTNGNRYDILMDVPLEVSVEIGRVNKPISEILQFNSGTIIELDKLVGEDVNIVINNRTIGKGEVVVIDECYGVRISEILENKVI